MNKSSCPICLTVSPWKSRVSVFYTPHSTAHAPDQWSNVFQLKHTKNYCTKSYLFPSTPSLLLPSSVSDLIYTVLDLVPVLRMKQLVRSLSVTDSEIEQAELDYRPCREAHYQMLRIWTERGSRAGGMLHRPLLQELLNELRKMHLGRAAEELETKYGIQ